MIVSEAKDHARRWVLEEGSKLRELGIASPADLEERVAMVEALLPRVSQVAEEIMAANSEIEG